MNARNDTESTNRMLVAIDAILHDFTLCISKYTLEISRLLVGTDVHLLSDGGTNEKVEPLCPYTPFGIKTQLFGPRS